MEHICFEVQLCIQKWILHEFCGIPGIWQIGCRATSSCLALSCLSSLSKATLAILVAGRKAVSLMTLHDSFIYSSSQSATRIGILA